MCSKVEGWSVRIVRVFQHGEVVDGEGGEVVRANGRKTTRKFAMPASRDLRLATMFKIETSPTTLASGLQLPGVADYTAIQYGAGGKLLIRLC